MGRKLREIIEGLRPERQAKIMALADQKVKDMLSCAKSLADFRKAIGKTQEEVAKELGIKQNAVSQLEQRSDLYVSTLQRFVGALGMKLDLSLTTKNGIRIDLEKFHPWDEIQAISQTIEDSRMAVSGMEVVRVFQGKARRSPIKSHITATEPKHVVASASLKQTTRPSQSLKTVAANAN